METFIITLLITSVSICAAFIGLIMFWYNGVLEVTQTEDGDKLHLDINEYDMIRKKKLMVILIKRK